MSTTSKSVRSTIRTWEDEKKKELVVLGESKKEYGNILKYLEKEISDSKRMVNFDYKISCFRSDGIYQLNKAIEESIGASSVKSEQSMSGPDKPANTIDVEVDGIRRKVIYGKVDLPDMGEDAYIDIAYDDNLLYIRGVCQMRFQNLIDEIVNNTIKYLGTQSIYRGQAIEISNNNNGQPTVINLNHIDKELMIIDSQLEYELSPLKARILQTERCIERNIPLKYGALLYGNYGEKNVKLFF